MKATIARWLRSCAQWLDPRVQVDDVLGALAFTQDKLVAIQAEHSHCMPFSRDEMFTRAQSMTANWRDRDVSGEFKRHQVLATLIDEFPQRRKREMAIAIEAALWP